MLKFASNIKYLFNNIDLVSRIQASAGAGFQAVECQRPYDIPSAKMRRSLADAGVEMALINAPAGNGDGDKGLGIFSGRISEFQRETERAIVYAAEIDCQRLHVMAGQTNQDTDLNGAETIFKDNIAWAAELGQRHGVRILLEPLNPIDNPGYFLTQAAQAVRLIEAISHPNVYLQYDLYHAGMNGEDIIGPVGAYLGLIDHIQIAGVPGRHEPDTGDIDFNPALKFIGKLGYKGWIGCEYAPLGRVEDGLAWAVTHGFGT